MNKEEDKQQSFKLNNKQRKLLMSIDKSSK